VNNQFPILTACLVEVRKTRLILAAIVAGMSLEATPAPADPQVKTVVPPAATNALAELVAPKSLFLIPSNPQEGKDPFFPRSLRVYASSVIVLTNTTNSVAAPSLDLRLNGVSGTSAHPLAIINNRTFEVGEEGELTSNSGRARLRVLDIKADYVVVQVGGERRILRLRVGI